jgi:WD40 repeat protein
VTYLPGGTEILVADVSGSLSRWSLAGGRRQEVASAVPRLYRLVVSPDGGTAFGLSYHERQLWSWDLRDGRARRLDRDNGEYMTLAVSADGKWVAADVSLDGRAAAGLYALDGRPIVPLEVDLPVVRDVGFTPSGRYVLGAIADGSVFRYDLEHGTYERAELHRGDAMAITAVTDDLVVSTGDDRVALWAPALGISATLPQSFAHVRTLSLSPSRTRLFGFGERGEAFVWDLATGERSMRWIAGGLLGSAWIDDEHLVTTADTGVVQIWSLPPARVGSAHETRAWLETLTNARVHESGERQPRCD